MGRRRIEGTRHVRRKMKLGARIAIGAMAIALVAAAGTLICKRLNSDKYSLKVIASRVESAFRGAAAEGAVIKISTSATTNPDGSPMGYVSGGGTLINRSTGGNTLTLTANGSGDNIFSGWTVNGTKIGSMDTTLKVCIDTTLHDKEYYDSSTKTLYVADTSDIQAVYKTPLKAPSNGEYGVGLYITPNTGHAWIDSIDGHPDSWSGYICIPSGHGGESARLVLQYVDGDSARAYVYDNNMKQISTGTGHKSDTKDLYVDFKIPDVDSWITLYCIPRLNQTDNSCFAIIEANPADAGTCGGTMTSGSSPFTTQLQATPNKGYKLKDWTVIFDGVSKTLTDKNPSVYINGTYKIIANFEEAYYDVTLEEVKPSDGGSVTGLDSYKEGSSPDISITCNEGYELDNWSYTTTDGIVHSGTNTTFTIPNIKEDIALYVTFKSDKKRVDVKASPASGGTATIKNTTAGTAEKSDYEEFINGQNATITATPNDGYKFLYWKDVAGNQITSATQTFAVNSDDTYTAYFVSNAINVKTAVTPEGKGGVKIEYTDKDGTTQTSEVLGDHMDVQSNVGITLTGTDITSSGYHFAEFVDSKGNHHIPTSGNVVTIGGSELLNDETYTALFVPEQAKITINSVPEIVGSVFKINDEITTSKDVTYGTSLTLFAEASNHKVRYWKDQNGTIIKPGDTGCSSDGKTLNIEAKYGDRIYTVYFVEDKCDLAVNVSPAGAGKYVLGSDDPTIDSTEYTTGHVYSSIPSVANYTINATPNLGYVIDRYVDEDGNTLEKNASGYGEINALDKNKQVTIYFAEEMFNVTAEADPVTAGSVKVNDHYGSDKVRSGEKAVLSATPAHGYLFKGWYTAPGGNDADKQNIDNPYTIDPITTDMKLYAHFAQENVTVTIGPAASGTGSVKLYGKDPVTEDTAYQVPGSSTITAEAYPYGGNVFEKWVDGKGKEYTDNPLTITDVKETLTLKAYFKLVTYEITPAANIVDAGTVTVSTESVNNSTSKVTVDGGSRAVLRATPATGYTFTYWTDSAGTQYDGRRGMDGGSTLTIDHVYKSDTYTAHFVKKDITIMLEASPTGAGMVRLDNNPFESDRIQYHVKGNSTVEISAEPKDPTKYKFERWESKTDPTKVYTTNPLTIVSVTEPLHYVAVFTPLTIGVKVEASPASGGKVTKTYNDDGSITITATANEGYQFANWKKGDKLLTLGNKYTIKADDVRDGEVYTAYFKTDENYDAKSDITKENFYRESRKVYNTNYRVTRASMQQQAQSIVSGLHQYDDATPPLRNFAAFSEARAYYESLLSDTDIKKLSSTFGNSELITAEGESLNLDLLPDYEVYEKKAEAFTLKKFGDRYETEILTVKRVYEPNNFKNVNRTYLWRYTGAQYKDNIYILYHIDGEEAWATPVVDKDDVIKFTLDMLPDNDVLAVVRVKIK